ncbi:hypothetical protein [Cytophaga aurantiaca]|uniref:hypothetical protein n=1 Tax=Cytophaga aurantiaca TaxID=29530 RepID=UPI00037FD3F9|nr:hypothetical protein [Cytophaga aurantiaca]
MNYEYSDTYWDDYKQFIQLFKDVMMSKYSDTRSIQMYHSPNTIIEVWGQVVGAAEYYPWSIYDWWDDLSVRDAVEFILTNEKIKSFEYFYDNFKKQIEDIDNKLLNISFEFSVLAFHKNWWERRILKYGQDEYKANVRELYEIDLDTYKNE